MADKETRADAREEANMPGKPDSDDIKLPVATVHRAPNTPLTKAD